MKIGDLLSLPLDLDEEGCITDADGDVPPDSDEVAAAVARAVNLYDSMVAALELARPVLQGPNAEPDDAAYDAVCAALAAAEAPLNLPAAEGEG